MDLENRLDTSLDTSNTKEGYHYVVSSGGIRKIPASSVTASGEDAPPPKKRKRRKKRKDI